MTVDKVIETIKAVKCGYDAGDEQLVHYIETAENMILSDIVSGARSTLTATANGSCARRSRLRTSMCSTR